MQQISKTSHLDYEVHKIIICSLQDYRLYCFDNIRHISSLEREEKHVSVLDV